MARKKHMAEVFVAKLRRVEFLTAQGRPIAEPLISIVMMEVSYYL